MRYYFVWDPAKARSNLAKHGVSFEIAAAAFADPLLITRPDAHHGDRWITIGSSKEQLLVIVHIDTERTADESQEQIRIVSARRATPRERRAYRDER